MRSWWVPPAGSTATGAARFYPQKLPQRLWLEHYAEHFATVEMQQRLLPAARARDLRAVAGADAGRTSAVAVKASRFLTHIKRLREPEEPVDRLLERAPRRSATSSARSCCSCRRRCGPTPSSLDECLAQFPRRHPGRGRAAARDLVDRRDPRAARAPRRGAVLGRPRRAGRSPRCGARPTGATCASTRGGRTLAAVRPDDAAAWAGPARGRLHRTPMSSSYFNNDPGVRRGPRRGGVRRAGRGRRPDRHPYARSAFPGRDLSVPVATADPPVRAFPWPSAGQSAACAEEPARDSPKARHAGRMAYDGTFRQTDPGTGLLLHESRTLGKGARSTRRGGPGDDTRRAVRPLGAVGGLSPRGVGSRRRCWRARDLRLGRRSLPASAPSEPSCPGRPNPAPPRRSPPRFLADGASCATR